MKGLHRHGWHLCSTIISKISLLLQSRKPIVLMTFSTLMKGVTAVPLRSPNSANDTFRGAWWDWASFWGPLAISSLTSLPLGGAGYLIIRADENWPANQYLPICMLASAICVYYYESEDEALDTVLGPLYLFSLILNILYSKRRIFVEITSAGFVLLRFIFLIIAVLLAAVIAYNTAPAAGRYSKPAVYTGYISLVSMAIVNWSIGLIQETIRSNYLGNQIHSTPIPLELYGGPQLLSPDQILDQTPGVIVSNTLE